MWVWVCSLFVCGCGLGDIYKRKTSKTFTVWHRSCIPQNTLNTQNSPANPYPHWLCGPIPQIHPKRQKPKTYTQGQTLPYKPLRTAHTRPTQNNELQPQDIITITKTVPTFSLVKSLTKWHKACNADRGKQVTTAKQFVFITIEHGIKLARRGKTLAFACSPGSDFHYNCVYLDMWQQNAVTYCNR